ncbi:hypothetical protein SAMN05444162_3167 [Paenibacillaceae bacterium GAS479]|nr:hypothetical protein SAMN05444162_3167 [Paenibacillaceae bacterium GAS479]
MGEQNKKSQFSNFKMILVLFILLIIISRTFTQDSLHNNDPEFGIRNTLGFDIRNELTRHRLDLLNYSGRALAPTPYLMIPSEGRGHFEVEGEFLEEPWDTLSMPSQTYIEYD